MSHTGTRSGLALALLLAACGGGGGGPGRGTNPCTSGAVCGEVALSLDAVNAAVAPPAGLRAAAPQAAGMVAPEWLSGGIVSGAPDELRLHVKSIWAAPANGSALVPIFESADTRGTVVTLSSGRLDLAAALAVDGFALPPGDYSRLELDVSQVAEIRGCVSGKFQSTQAVTGTPRELNSGWATAVPAIADLTFSNDPITDGQVHRFCTRATPNEVTVPTFTTDPIGSNDDFEAVSDAELTEIYLSLDNREDLDADGLRAGTVTVSSAGAFTVAEGTPVALTLAMDLNRMLRYFANTRADLGAPNPFMKGGTSYFFTTVFPFSTVLVPDDGATIEGYQLTVTALKTGGSELVPGWLTVVRGAGGAVVGGVVIGDDDNGLTVAKGNLAPVAADDGAGSWTLDYSLGGGDGGAPFTGHLQGFHFQAVDGSGTCTVTVDDAPWLSNFTGFTAAYTRKL